MAPNNPLTIYGNEKTMNLNSLILTNIQSSPYFKVNLFELKTYHQVIDEIYYKVEHLEPWEKGSRKTAGQTGMCGGVRGVGAGGIVSSAYCLVYKLFTLKLTKKQVIGLITHQDSAYIRCLGFMYIRYTQNPADMWEWYSPYMEDEEEVDVKAGGGHMMKIGDLLRQWMLKLEWYSTLFPRVPVPIQKQNELRLREYEQQQMETRGYSRPPPPEERAEEPPHEAPHGRGGPRHADPVEDRAVGFGEAERQAKLRESPKRGESSDRRRDNKGRSRSRERERDRHSHRDRRRSRSRDRGHRRSRSRDRQRRSKSRDRQRRSRSKDRHRHKRSRSRERGHGESTFDRELKREKDRVRNGR